LDLTAEERLQVCRSALAVAERKATGRNWLTHSNPKRTRGTSRLPHPLAYASGYFVSSGRPRRKRSWPSRRTEGTGSDQDDRCLSPFRKHNDYPEICDPILALDGTAQRGATQTANGKRTFLKWAQDYIVLPTVRVPDHWDRRLRPGEPSLGSGAVITTRGLDSAIRGVLVGTKRPDLVIIDDPESARLGPQRRPVGPPRTHDRGGPGRTF
jgi:hypothetical protein